MAPALTAPERKRALSGLKLAEAYIQGVNTDVPEEFLPLVNVLIVEGQRVKQAGMSLVLALLKQDEYAPVELFAPWASVRRFREWRDDPAVKLDVVIKHGKTCVRPAAFFAHWNSLPEETKRKTMLSAGKSSGATTFHPGGRNGHGTRSAGAGRG